MHNKRNHKQKEKTQDGSKYLELPYDPAIPFLGIYPEKTKIQSDTCTPKFTAALFTIDKTGRKPERPLTGVDKKAVVHTHNGILLSHNKEVTPYAAASTDLEIAILRNHIRGRQNII